MITFEVRHQDQRYLLVKRDFDGAECTVSRIAFLTPAEALALLSSGLYTIRDDDLPTIDDIDKIDPRELLSFELLDGAYNLYINLPQNDSINRIAERLVDPWYRHTNLEQWWFKLNRFRRETIEIDDFEMPYKHAEWPDNPTEAVDSW